MNWKDIRLNEFEKTFYFNGQALFAKRQFMDALPFHDPGLAPVQDQTGWYHIDVKGKPVYPDRYIRAFGYYCGWATVVGEQGWFHINSDGKAQSQKVYSWCGNFQGGVCTVRDASEAYFHIDMSGEKCYPETYHYAGDFRKGFACVMNQYQEFTHIDQRGQFLHGKWFLDLGVFHKGYATARDKDGWCHIDLNGKAIYDHRFTMVEPFYNGWALATTLIGKKICLNENGEIRFLG